MKRSLSDWASIAEIIGAAAIVISLIFVGLEIRESGRQTQLNTQAVQGTALQQHFDQHTSLLMMAVSSPSVLASLMKATDGFDELTDQERFVFSTYAASVMRNHFVAHELMQSGLLPRAQGQTFEAALRRAIQRYLGIRQLWALRRNEYPEGFRAKVDALVSEAEAAELNATE